MRLPSLYPWLAAACLYCTPLGCSLNAADTAPETTPPGVSGPNASIGFAGEGTIALAPGELTTLTVKTTPPNNYEISFFLLGEAFDASLGKNSVVAGADGKASVELRAPDTSTTFRLRASIKDGPSAEVAIAVSAKGFGTVRVVPLYAGHRPIAEWTASLVAGATCADIAATLPGEPEGAIQVTVPGNQEPVIDTAPVGPNLAVTLRAGHYLWGCADTSDLASGATLDLKVTVVDKPIDLLATDLDLAFTYAPDPGPYAELLQGAATLLRDAVFPPQQPEAKTLLDEMVSGLPQPADVAAFNDQRTAQGWDDKTAMHLAAGSASLSELIAEWSTAGLSQADPSIVGHLVAAGDAPGEAILAIDAFAGVPAGKALVPGEHLVKWTADAEDVVSLTGVLYWMPSRYVGAAALGGAQTAQPMALTVHDALAAAARCDELGNVLGPVGSCDAACMADLCATAIASRWDKGLQASGAVNAGGELSITASGPSAVGDAAEPTEWNAQWLGQVKAGAAEASVQGTVQGKDGGDNPPD